MSDIVNTGSSPRVWGQVTITDTMRTKLRIIPTRVGTSLIPDKQNLVDEDHPHACGDKNTIVLIDEIGTGSSPRVWGQD